MNERQKLEAEYTTNNGRITSPGKFEGEMIYVPYFWGSYLDGLADRDHNGILGFDLTQEDKELFPELKHRRTINLYENEQGFVSEVK